MADKQTEPDTPQAASAETPAAPQSKKRAAPTIDLTATEVPPAATPGGEPPGDPANAPRSDRLGNIKRPALAGGLAGAAVVALAVAGLWLAGLIPTRGSGGVAPAPDSQSTDALNARIGKIEDSLAKISPSDAGANERIAAAENAMKALGLTLSALNRRSDEIAANAARAGEQADAAQKASAELRGRVEDVAKNPSAGATSGDVPARLALSAAALREVVASGAPYAALLAQAKSLGADAKALAPLESFAANGVPTPAALAQELRALLPAMLKMSGSQAPEGGFLERLQANAGKLVRIRPLDAPPGDDASAVLARIEIDAAHNDIGGALGDLAKLPDAARAPAQAWMTKAGERQAAIAAARAFALESARTLGQP